MSEHTPGPWQIKRGEIWSNQDDLLGVVYRTEAWTTGEKVKTEDQANARLMAAAPELLKALKFIETWISQPVGEFSVAALDGLFDQTRGIARAAIAKATGEST